MAGHVPAVSLSAPPRFPKAAMSELQDHDLADPPAREPIFNVPRVVVWLIGALAAVHAVRAYLLDPQTERIFVWSLAFVPARYDSAILPGGVVPGGEAAAVWSFITYALLHADIMHLGFNAIWLLAFGTPVARRFGTLGFLALCAAATVAGAIAHLVSHAGQITPMIGASAAVSGAMGAATRFVFQIGGPLDGWRVAGSEHIPAAPLAAALRNPRVIGFLAVWFGVNLVFGIGAVSIAGEDQAVAWQAHIGGFLAGLLLFPAFDRAGRS